MNSKLILILILILAAILRLYNLSNNPPHLTSDEAALGYNAYSILKTGRDEHGELLPVIFKSFGDWKPGLYVYLTTPFVAAFGLSEFSTRIVSALSGIIAVYLLFCIVKLLSNKPQIALFASFFLAISPWHLQFSRGAWEANLSLTITLTAIYFFLKSIYQKSTYLLPSSIFFAFTFWAYQGAKMSTGIVLVILFSLYLRQIIKIPLKSLFVSTLIGFIIVSPILLSFVNGKTGRLDVYSVFSYPRPDSYTDKILNQAGEKRDDLVYALYHSEPLNFTQGILSRWFNHYSGRFLFFEGDWSNPRHTVPNNGVLLLFDSILVVLGIAVLLRNKISKSTLFIFLWVLSGTLPAALSRDSIHAIRSLNTVIPLSIILAYGAYYLLAFMNKFRFRYIVLTIIVILYLSNLAYYLDQYWIHAPHKNSKAWQYGYKELVEKITPIQSQYPEIIVQQEYTQPYIFFLFYQKYNPGKYQAQAKANYKQNAFGDVGFVEKLDNIIFKEINWPTDRGLHGRLFAGDIFKIPEKDSSDMNLFKTLDTIYVLDGQVVFRLVEVK